jgi:hypothetical protein
VIGRTAAHVVARAASILLLADSRAGFEIEGERPPRGRQERWGRAVLQAGKNLLTLDEILRVYGVLIEDTRFVRAGLRPDGVFLGERDHLGDPLPEFIGARPADLQDLMQGMIAANERMREGELDSVLQAATAFDFVYVHPIQDGNGRLHRCLIHHVLAERKFTPPGMVSLSPRSCSPGSQLPRHTARAFGSADELHRMAAGAGETAPRRRSFSMPASRGRSTRTCRVKSNFCGVMTRRCAAS